MQISGTRNVKLIFTLVINKYKKLCRLNINFKNVFSCQDDIIGIED